MKLPRYLALGCLSMLALAPAACRDNTPTSTSTTTGATPPANAPDANVMMPYATPVAAQGTPAVNDKGTPNAGMATDTMLTDAQILQVTHTANAGEIAQAKLAQDKAQSAAVKKLAQMMLTDHTDADKKGADLAKKENFMLSDSMTSASLKTDADHTTDGLRSKTGAEFDKAYVDAQVKEHQAVLDTIDNKLMTNVKDAEVKSYLQTVRPKIAEHLKHAQSVQTDLAK